MTNRIPLPDQLTLDRGTQNTLLRQVRVFIDRNLCDVLWALHRLTNVDRPTVQISVRQIANELQASESTARRAIRKLEAIGFLSNDEVIGPNGREQNRYRVIWSEIRETVLTGRVESIPTSHDQHCPRDLETGRWSRQTVELGDQSEIFAMAGGGEFDEVSDAFGTHDAGPVNLTGPARSNRPGRSGQSDRAGQVKLTGPSISSLPFHSPFHSPTPQTPVPTRLDADWLVVVDELIFFGIWKDAAERCVEEARSKGLTPQTVSGLVRFAAGKVIALDDDGRPVEQWRMPIADLLDLTQPQPQRLYLWGPPMVLARIKRHEPWMGIATDWPKSGERQAEYQKAQQRLASVTTARVSSGHGTPPQAANVARVAYEAETSRLESELGERLDALSEGETAALVPSSKRMFMRGELRRSLNRAIVLRLFAESLGVSTTPTSSEPQRT